MSKYRMDFAHQYLYSASTVISLPITLTAGTGKLVDLTGIVDTASRFCVLRRDYAERLDLDLLSGVRQRILTAAGSFTAYGHELLIQLFDYQWEATVFFHEDEGFSRNILGRTGFLDHLKIGLVDYDQTLFIGLYEDLE